MNHLRKVEGSMGIERKKVKIGHREVGDGAPVFITFEAGPTHDGVATAKELVSHAARSGADAVKFQIVDPDRLVADRAQTISYEVLVDRESGKTETKKESLYEVLKLRALTHAQWREVKAHSDSLKLAFFATVAFEDEIKLLEDIGCHSIKIASGDVNHLPLIRCAARTGMCIQLDTGNSNLGEIEAAVDVIRNEGNENIIIHQCPSGYPAHLDSVNLRIITTLRQMFPYPVAFSDHTPGNAMDIAAVAIGANVTEKTISLDRTTRGIEHIMSLEPKEMEGFVRSIRDLEVALGAPRRILHEAEKKRRMAIRRSVFLNRAVQQGQLLHEASVIFRRPGFGLPPDVFETLSATRFRRDLPEGHMVTSADLE
jgi:sialic acid synthase SpsE